MKSGVGFSAKKMDVNTGKSIRGMEIVERRDSVSSVLVGFSPWISEGSIFSSLSSLPLIKKEYLRYACTVNC